FHGPLPGPDPGGPVTLDWSPATDHLDISKVTLDGVEIVASHELVIRDGRIGFRLPSTVSPGPHTLGLEVYTQAGVAHCEPDPGACFTWLPHDMAPTSPEVTITVQ